MALPQGPISMGQVNTELNRPFTQAISLGDSAVRTLAGQGSGAISMSQLQGKSNGPTASLAVTSLNSSGEASERSPGFAAAYTQVNVSGGVAPYSYQWYAEAQSQTGGSFSLQNSTSSSAQLQFTAQAGNSVSGAFWCVVTAANGASSTSDTGSFYLNITQGSGGPGGPGTIE